MNKKPHIDYISTAVTHDKNCLIFSLSDGRIVEFENHESTEESLYDIYRDLCKKLKFV